MTKLQQNRYLWVHFASLAFVPLLLDICLAGLASAGPALPYGGQYWVIALIAVAPGLAMQWFKPFYIFGLPPIVLKPTRLSESQRRCLQIFKSWQIKALSVVVALFCLWMLVQLYALSPEISPMLAPTAGLVSAAIAFFFACSFLQISVSSMRALLVGPDALPRVPAYVASDIAADFLLLGLRVNAVLPDAAFTEPEPPISNSEEPSFTGEGAKNLTEEPAVEDSAAPEELSEPEVSELEAVEPEAGKPELKLEAAEPETAEPEPSLGSDVLETQASTENQSEEENDVEGQTTAADNSSEAAVIIPETLPPLPKDDF